MRLRPDILVLGGGGVLGEAWETGVLAGLEDAAGYDLRDCEYFVGTSAGSLVAARLAAGRRPRRPAERDDDPDTRPAAYDDPEARAANRDGPGSGLAGPDPGKVVAVRTAASERPRQLSVSVAARTALTLAEATASWGATAALNVGRPVLPTGLALAAPGGALARAAALRAMPRPAGEFDQLRGELDGLPARFDGRLRIVAVARASGRRMVFGRPRAPHASVADAVAASCSVPWLVAPVRIAGVEYVDGGVWSPTNLDIAPAKRDTQVLCLSPTAGLFGPGGTLVSAGPMSPIARRVSRGVTLVEAAALRGRRAVVSLLAPDEEATAAIGYDLMDSGRAGRVLRAGYRQGLLLGR